MRTHEAVPEVSRKLFSAVRSCPPADRAGPLAQLRAATRAHHQRIDRLMDLRRMRDPGHYAGVLRVFDAFLAAWEPAVAAALPPQWHAWLDARSRRPFLERDLAVLGIAPADADARVPSLSSAAAAWGSVYVMEGSALGGQFITRSLAEAGLFPHRGAAYFHGWGERTASMWRDCRTTLEEQLADPRALADACDAACRTFDTLSNLLESALHERTAVA
ncbi:MAG: heme oxygenase [Comamonadaceae bacterium]|nr:MAG: heme oxygenase [Comamonadaceae bacterium]